MTTYSVIMGSPRGGSILQSGAFGSFGWLTKGLDPDRAAEHGLQIRKDREGSEVVTHDGEIFDIR